MCVWFRVDIVVVVSKRKAQLVIRVAAILCTNAVR
jgi:hypothetical protein